MHDKKKDGTKITHVFTMPNDVVIERIEDEYIVELDCGYPTERTFTFNKVYVDVFSSDDEIILGVINPEQFEVFFDIKELVIEYEKDSGIGYIEVY